MHIPKLFSLFAALVIITAVLPSTTFAQAAATDLFIGTAVTGVGQTSPVDINRTDIAVRPADGAVGVGYVYRASGKASGDIPGRFEYVEHGYLFFRNPADPTTFLGGHYVSGVFTLTPANGHRAPISIVDTDPSAYRSGQSSLPLPGGHGASAAYGAALNKLHLLAPGGMAITYGSFTFTNAYGTQTGYATPDFRSFSIRLTFDAGL